MKKLLIVFIILLSSIWAESEENKKYSYSLSIMSFNIRRDIGDKSTCEKEWKDYRFKKFQSIISNSTPDIVCLQEVQDSEITSQYKDVVDFMLYLGYNNFKGKRGSSQEFIPIFWKKDKFVKTNNSDLSYYIGSMFFKYRLFSCVELLCTDIKSKYYNKYFLIGNTHWKSGKLYNWHRSDSAEDIINILKDIIYDRENTITENSPILIAGDFNCNRNSFSYLTFKSFLKETSNYECTRPGFCNYSCFNVIDFIFYNNILFPKYNVLPQTEASDHLPVVMEF